MRFDISQSLYPDGKVRFIARDKDGIVRFREETEEKLLEAIKEFNETLAKEAEARAKAKSKGKGKDTRSTSSGQKGKEEITEDVEKPLENIAATAEEPAEVQSAQTPESPQQPQEESGKKFLQNDLREQVEEKKKKSGKKSFWDKLK